MKSGSTDRGSRGRCSGGHALARSCATACHPRKHSQVTTEVPLMAWKALHHSFSVRGMFLMFVFLFPGVFYFPTCSSGCQVKGNTESLIADEEKGKMAKFVPKGSTLHQYRERSSLLSLILSLSHSFSLFPSLPLPLSHCSQLLGKDACFQFLSPELCRCTDFSLSRKPRKNHMCALSESPQMATALRVTKSTCQHKSSSCGRETVQLVEPKIWMPEALVQFLVQYVLEWLCGFLLLPLFLMT